MTDLPQVAYFNTIRGRLMVVQYTLFSQVLENYSFLEALFYELVYSFVYTVVIYLKYRTTVPLFFKIKIDS